MVRYGIFICNNLLTKYTSAVTHPTIYKFLKITKIMKRHYRNIDEYTLSKIIFF